MDFISILTWVSISAGGLLVVLLLLSMLGGLDLDVDMDLGSSDVDAGGMGAIKGGLTFISVGTWVTKVLLATAQHPAMAITIGIAMGIFAFVALSAFMRFLVRQEEDVNWSMKDALNQHGEVYLRIPGTSGSGIVQVNVKGATRELKAKSQNKEEIKTGESILVVDVEEEFVLVTKQS